MTMHFMRKYPEGLVTLGRGGLLVRCGEVALLSEAIFSQS